MSKTVLFQAVQFSISTQFSSIWLIDRALSGATIPGQSRHGSDGNEGLLRIPQSSSITETSPSDFLVSYRTHSLEVGSYSSAEMQSVYSTAPSPTEWAINWIVFWFIWWRPSSESYSLCLIKYHYFNEINNWFVFFFALKIVNLNSVRLHLSNIEFC